jgi:hypothetical protein
VASPNTKVDCFGHEPFDGSMVGIALTGVTALVARAVSRLCQ